MKYNEHIKVLALDMATTTGYALLANGVLSSGSQCFARLPATKKRALTHFGSSYAMFHRWLQDRIYTDKPQAIAYEEAMGFFKSAAAAQIAYGFRGVLMALAAAHNLPVYGYVAPTVKKYWAGTGKADKDMMIASTLIRLPGIDLTDGNEADALAILHLHISKL